MSGAANCGESLALTAIRQFVTICLVDDLEARKVGKPCPWTLEHLRG